MAEQLMVEISVRWWVVPYVKCCAVFARLFGVTPDVDRIARFITTYGLRARGAKA